MLIPSLARETQKNAPEAHQIYEANKNTFRNELLPVNPHKKHFKLKLQNAKQEIKLKNKENHVELVVKIQSKNYVFALSPYASHLLGDLLRYIFLPTQPQP